MAELARVKEVVPASVLRDGASVLNADNEWTVRMTRSARGEIIFFSMDEDNPVIQEHIREKGRAVLLKKTRQGEMLTIYESRRETSLLLASQIPATMDGRIRVNIENAMAAAAAALADDVNLDYIRLGLRTFSNSFSQAPGRFNMLDLGTKRVLMDYCHNVAGLQSIADFVSRMDSDRTVGVISLPGDRSNTDMQEFGELAAKTFDKLIIREDDNTRGRSAGEISGLLKSAALTAGKPESDIDIVLDEMEAMKAALDRSEKGDLLVLLADKPVKVWEMLTHAETV
jgi:cyanophycin synthetase